MLVDTMKKSCSEYTTAVRHDTHKADYFGTEHANNGLNDVHIDHFDDTLGVPARSPSCPQMHRPNNKLEARTPVSSVPSLRDFFSSKIARSSMPMPMPRNRDPRLVADWLQDRHARTANTLRMAFGSTPAVSQAKRFIINTVTLPEAIFLANHLDVPHENIISINTRRWPDTSTRVRIHETLRPFLDAKRFDGGALTFLGHMHDDLQSGFGSSGLHHAFAKLPASDLFRLFRDIKPKHLNMFSCFSEQYSEHLHRLFAADGTSIPHRAFFRSEVSPYPSHATKNRPIRFFYVGPELSNSAGILELTKHTPIMSGNHMGVAIVLNPAMLPPPCPVKKGD